MRTKTLHKAYLAPRSPARAHHSAAPERCEVELPSRGRSFVDAAFDGAADAFTDAALASVSFVFQRTGLGLATMGSTGEDEP